MADTKNFRSLLSGADLRSTGNSDLVASQVGSLKDFELLLNLLSDPDRLVVMRAADAIEKITREKPEYLSKFSAQIFQLCKAAIHKELMWHLALILPRLVLNNEGSALAGRILTAWALDNRNSSIVRVNSLQGLYELSRKHKALINDLIRVLAELEKEPIPSIHARIRNIKRLL